MNVSWSSGNFPSTTLLFKRKETDHRVHVGVAGGQHGQQDHRQLERVVLIGHF